MYSFLQSASINTLTTPFPPVTKVMYEYHMKSSQKIMRTAEVMKEMRNEAIAEILTFDLGEKLNNAMTLWNADSVDDETRRNCLELIRLVGTIYAMQPRTKEGEIIPNMLVRIPDHYIQKAREFYNLYY